MNAARLPQQVPPVLVRVGAPVLNVIVDASLALSPFGLLRTMRLARSACVWLPRSLWSLLDNDAVYRQHPERLGGLPQAALARMADEMPVWRQAWHYGRLAADVHWIGDARYEGSVPDRNDTGLLQRFEACRAGLDTAMGVSDDSPLADCARDAAALAAALQPERIVILAAGGGEGDPPPICAALAEAGVAIRAAKPPYHGTGLAAALVPCDAQPLIVIDVVAPGALALGDGWGLDLIDDEGAATSTLWRNAYAAWWPLVEAEG